MNLLTPQLEKKFIEMGSEMLRKEYFRRLEVEVETRKNLREINELYKWIDFKLPAPPQEFEDRLERFANGRK